jgi:hypothetical protein
LPGRKRIVINTFCSKNICWLTLIEKYHIFPFVIPYTADHRKHEESLRVWAGDYMTEIKLTLYYNLIGGIIAYKSNISTI